MSKKGIYYGWWILASSIVILFLTGIAFFGISSYYPSLIDTFGWSRSRLLVSNTILQWAYGGMGLVWGVIADKRGVRLVLSIGAACVALSYLLFTQVSALWQLYALAITLGAGLSAMGYLPNQILQSRWFVNRRGLAIGVINAASGLGGAIAPIVITFLIIRLGWRSSMGLIDVLFLTLPFMLIVFVIRERPKDLGLHPDGVAAEAAAADFRQGKPPLAQTAKSFRGIFLMPVFWVIIGAVFFAAGTIGTTIHLLILYLRDSGFSPAIAASALSLEFGFSIVGRVGFGSLSDYFSARKVGIVSFTLLGSSMLLLFGVRTTGVLVLFAVIHGLGHGAVVSFFPLMLAEAFGTKQHIGRLLAIGHLAYSAGIGSIPIISGYAFDTTGSFGLGFIINSIMTLLGALGLLVIGRYWQQAMVKPVPTLSASS